MTLDMPRRRLELRPLDPGDESIGQRLARFRNERGFTQSELAERIGLVQALVSDYERDKLPLNAAMLVRFGLVLGVSSDQLVGAERAARYGKPQSRRINRRRQALEDLLKRVQESLHRNTDGFLAKAT